MSHPRLNEIRCGRRRFLVHETIQAVTRLELPKESRYESWVEIEEVDYSRRQWRFRLVNEATGETAGPVRVAVAYAGMATTEILEPERQRLRDAVLNRKDRDTPSPSA